MSVAAPIPAFAADAPVSYKADPAVYKLLSENDQFRVIPATFKPGQRDAGHSHPSAQARYALTNCEVRIYTPDGKFVDVNDKKGTAAFSPAAPSHAVENRGKTRCETIIVERK